MPTPQVTKEIVVDLDNKPGTLAAVTNAIAGEGVNIVGYSLSAQGSKGRGHFVVSDPAKAMKAIQKAGYNPTQRDIVTLAVPNRPGELFKLSKRLADSGVNIEASFATIEPSGSEFQVAFCCDDIQSAKKVLSQ